MSTPVEALQGLFPGVPEATLQGALQQVDGNIDNAASLLLEQAVKSAQPQSSSKPSVKVLALSDRPIASHAYLESRPSASLCCFQLWNLKVLVSVQQENNAARPLGDGWLSRSSTPRYSWINGRTLHVIIVLSCSTHRDKTHMIK